MALPVVTEAASRSVKPVPVRVRLVPVTAPLNVAVAVPSANVRLPPLVMAPKVEPFAVTIRSKPPPESEPTVTVLPVLLSVVVPPRVNVPA